MSDELEIQPTEEDWWSRDVDLTISGERRAIAAVIGTLNMGAVALPATHPGDEKAETTEQSMILLSRRVVEEFVGIALLEEAERVGLSEVPKSAIRDIPLEKSRRTHGSDVSDFVQVDVEIAGDGEDA